MVPRPPLVSILVPWAPATGVSGKERDASWVWNRRRLELLLPDAEIILGVPPVTGDPAIFARSAALNRAAEEAQGNVLLICDADTTYEGREELALVTGLVRNGEWTLPERYVRLGPKTSLAWMRANPSTRPPAWAHDIEQEYPAANSGVVAMPAEALEAAGGFDERFRGWGGEDDAMRAQLETLWGPPTRIGVALHLWHPRPPEHSVAAPYTPASFMLADRYAKASGDRQAMLDLLAERR